MTKLMKPLLAAAAALAFGNLHAEGSAGQPKIDFSRDIRPILSENCFACHGPDEAERKADLRLDTQEGALAIHDGAAIIAPGNSAASELIKRITSEDPDDRMPPANTGKQLSAAQVDLLKRWIDQGAQWESHWAFQKPERPELPEVKNTAWPKNEIDRFILARLEKEGLEPSPEASKEILARRATLDLTGLPPTIAELDAFLADESPGAYEKVVDRLLNSSSYGEQMARYWLDSARYADSHGYHIDAPRMVWKYREYVINAFNENKPFDQFTIEQIAGDMLPDATTEQIVASGFNRCNMTTGEGGAIAEEYRVKYAADRTETVGTVWMGLTLGCAACHTHKFDPITQKEFYQMSAFFNSIAEPALDGNRPAPEPFIKVPSEMQAAELKRLDAAIAALKEKLAGPNEKLDQAQAAWEADWRRKLATKFAVLSPSEVKSAGGAEFLPQEDGSVLVAGANPAKDVYEVVLRTEMKEIGAIRLEALTHGSLPHKGTGRSPNANFVLTEVEVEAVSIADPEQRENVTLAFATADYSQKDFPARNAIDGKPATGWAVEGHVRREDRNAIFIPREPFGFTGGTELRVKLAFESQFNQHAIGRFRLGVAEASDGLKLLTPARFGDWRMAGPFTGASGGEAYDTDFGPEKGVDLKAAYQDGKVKWVVKREFADGKVNNLTGENAATYLYRKIRAPFEQEMTFSFGSDDAIKAWLNGEVILDQNVQRGIAPDQNKVPVKLRKGENELLVKVVNYSGGYAFYFNQARDKNKTLTPEIAQILAFGGAELTEKQKGQLRKFYRENFSPDYKEFLAEMEKTQAERKKLDDSIPVTMVSKELETPRDTYLLIRGEYDNRGEKVLPNVLAALPPLPKSDETNRLDLAKWLVNPENPLTARVTVNRFWQHYFGTGLVKTTGDFGSQGEAPSHPALLDWLAVEFMESGWNVKHIQRLIVTSATYRQTSKLSPGLLEKDPGNRLLARGPRFRMDAEMVRDNALAVSGLLVEEIGGPSVKPYQPEGLWEAVSYGFREGYVPDTGEGLYRRSMYTYWKRQSPPPGMTTLDAPSREVCTVKRPRTNTPLQALLLMNGDQYVEASRGLAERMMKEAETKDPAGRVRYGYRLATGRKAGERHVEVLLKTYEEQLAAYREDMEAAKALLEVGQSPPDETLEPAEYAAWTSIANILLNLDATITKS